MVKSFEKQKGAKDIDPGAVGAPPEGSGGNPAVVTEEQMYNAQDAKTTSEAIGIP